MKLFIVSVIFAQFLICAGPRNVVFSIGIYSSSSCHSHFDTFRQAASDLKTVRVSSAGCNKEREIDCKTHRKAERCTSNKFCISCLHLKFNPKAEYSGALRYESNSFHDYAHNSKHSSLKASFPDELNGNTVNPLFQTHKKQIKILFGS